MRALLGILLGLLVVYAFGALIVWDFDPGNWGWFWRMWCIGWCIPWCIMFFNIGYDADAAARVRYARKTGARL